MSAVIGLKSPAVTTNAGRHQGSHTLQCLGGIMMHLLRVQGFLRNLHFVIFNSTWILRITKD